MLGAVLRTALVLFGLAAAAPLWAQEATGPRPTPELGLFSSVVTLDRVRLFEDSLMGEAILARIEAASNDLVAENRRLEAALEAEERDLTARRAILPNDAFRELARDFDTKVEELRVAQEVKSRALTRMRDSEQQRFYEAAVPVLAELMQDLGAVAIIDRSAVILSFDRIDITAQAIARLDSELGDGSNLPPVPQDSEDGAGDGAEPLPALPQP
ncbi:OmpH family outer membrane protein [Pseudotabrizicola algicola]|uniref:OmpH family outer membrane protein n=1 Tax=Pseudotabrizicola algicola TaxID=2709381 RepID=A0A6B3RJ18_9RHOB|nr:OmpH family outer membrane protein [Pseudotabrizicola algicola]NEX45103.1 OmpH family outer membrane protein [Pseudotabrizicola algicola]